MKKSLITIVTLLVFLMLAACGGGNSKGSSKDKITIWTQASADHPEGQMFADRIDEYNEGNPDKLQVEIQNITRAGAGSGYIDKLNAALTSDSLPDIFTLDGPDVAAYVNSKVVGGLDDYLSDGFKEGFTEAMIDQGTVDGEFYALGYSDSAVAVMYNEDMINALPDDIQELVPNKDEDWSWDEFVDLAKEINEFAEITDDPAFDDYEVAVSLLLTDVTSGVYETGTYYFTPLLWGNDSNIVSDDGVTVDGILNSDESVEALERYARLFEEDGLASTSESEKAFHSGKTALSVSGFWYVNEINSNYPDLKYRTVRYPKMDENHEGGYTPSGSWTFVRSAGVDEEKVEQVVEVLEWLTNDEAAEEYFEANGSIPGRIEAIPTMEAQTDNPYNDEAWEVMQYQVEHTNKARPTSPGYPYLSETFAKDILLKIAQNKGTDKDTIKEYVDEAVKKINLEFEKYN